MHSSKCLMHAMIKSVYLSNQVSLRYLNHQHTHTHRLKHTLSRQHRCTFHVLWVERSTGIRLPEDASLQSDCTVLFSEISSDIKDAFLFFFTPSSPDLASIFFLQNILFQKLKLSAAYHVLKKYVY